MSEISNAPNIPTQSILLLQLSPELGGGALGGAVDKVEDCNSHQLSHPSVRTILCRDSSNTHTPQRSPP